MKKIYVVVACLLFSGIAHAQVGIGTETPNAHSVLELKSPSNNQGLILPSLTTGQRTSTIFTNQLGAPENGLLVYDKDENKFYFWLNNAWQIIVSGTITGGAIGPASGDLTGNYPGPQIASGAILTAKLADGSVTDVKVASVAPSKITAGGATAGQVLKWNGTNWTAQPDNVGTGTVTTVATGAGLAGGPITGTGTLSLADNGVTTVKINDAAVTTLKLADGSVTDVKVTSVAPSKLTAGGATNGQVLKYNGTNWTAQADNAGTGTVTNVATGAGLTGGPITATGTLSLADNGVTTIKLADGSVTDVKVTSVAPSKLTAGGASTGQVLKYNGTNWTAQADNAGTGTVTNVATGAGLTGGPITATGTLSLADNGVTTIKINDGAVTSAKIADATIVTGDLADASVTDVKVSSVSPTKLTASGAATGEVLKWNGTNWTPQADNGGGAGTVTSVATGAGLTGGPITTTGTVSLADNGVTSIKIADGSIVNADINAAAAIADTKLATITTAGKVSGNAVTSGTIAGTTAMNTSGNISTTGLITATNATTGSVVTSSNSVAGGYAVSGSSTSTNLGGGIYGTGSGVTIGRTTTYSYGVYGYNSFSGAFGWIGGDEGVHGDNTTGTGVTGNGYYGVNGSGSFIGVIGSAPAVSGNYGVFSSGQAGGTTTWAATSDARFKKNIRPLSNSLESILKLRGVSYDWRTEEFPKKNFKTTRDIGVIAQEVLEIVPEVVVQDREGYYSVSYEKMVPLLIEAIKELEKKVNTLEQQNEAIVKLKGKVEALEALLHPVAKVGLAEQ